MLRACASASIGRTIATRVAAATAAPSQTVVPAMFRQTLRRTATEASSSAAPTAPKGFFRSDSWIKTVGTVGALANWGIPLAAISHILENKDPINTIDPVMTSSLAIYSILFMRWSLAISPANYPLFICHVCNEAAQLFQLFRHYTAKPAALPAP
eukprot:c1062_g1_i1.p1 GENE.c1062_g1_i1~~c1062_g1_i1.p1  ORF type:complete len:165 (+),score=18.06 c1062_g1_i1:33-497(+)